MIIKKEELGEVLPSIQEEILNANGNVVALTGAGISKASGIPTFRGPEGKFKGKDSTELANPYTFSQNPKLVWEWYKYRMEIIHKAKPNPAHLALAELENKGLLNAVITQNVDGLHQKAGNKNVIEIHGSIWRMKCVNCDYKTQINEPISKIPPRCPNCNNILRPDVVWYGEVLPEEAIKKSHELIRNAKVLIVVGTSGLVMPAARFPGIAAAFGATVIDINPIITPVSEIAKWAILEKAEEILPLIVSSLNKT